MLYLIVIVLPYSWYSDATTMEPVDSTGLPVSPDGIVLVNMTYESYLW